MGPIIQPSNGYYHHHSLYDYLDPTSFLAKCNTEIHQTPLYCAHLHPKHICSQGVKPVQATLKVSSRSYVDDKKCLV